MGLNLTNFQNAGSPNRIIPGLIAFLMVLLMYLLHMSPGVDSMLNENNTTISDGFLSSQIQYHKELPAFSRRPLTTFLIESAASVFRLSPGEAFILVNYALFFLSGLLLFALSRKLRASPGQALFNMMAYFLGFSVLFAFFPPIFSYDEPLQYCLLFASFLAFFSQARIAFVILFTAACISKEASLFLLPGIALFFTPRSATYPWLPDIRKVGFLCVPVILYFAYLLLFLYYKELWGVSQVEMIDRISCFSQNFSSQDRAVETFFSFFLVLGPFMAFLLLKNKGGQSSFHKAFWITLLLNTTVVLTATLARESRLFAVPLFFTWPILGQLLLPELKLLLGNSSALRYFKDLRFPAFLAFLSLLNYLLAFKVYRPTFGPPADNYFNEYCFLLLTGISLYLLLRMFHPRRIAG